MQKQEYFIKNACYSVTKYYLCKQNNKRSFFSSKQRHKALRSFPNRYQFSLCNKLTLLFSNSCILEIILPCKTGSFTMRNNGYCNTLNTNTLYKTRLYVKSLHFNWVIIAIKWCLLRGDDRRKERRCAFTTDELSGVYRHSTSGGFYIICFITTSSKWSLAQSMSE